MLKVIRSNQKYFLAGLMILSMLGFVVNRGNGTKDMGTDRQFATIEGKPVLVSEMNQVRAELDALKHINFGMDDQNGSYDAYIDSQMAMAILQQKPEVFMLLRHETRNLGIHASDDDVQKYVRFRSQGLEPAAEDYAKSGVEDMLSILARYHTLQAAVKVSRPQIDQTMATASESLILSLAQFKAEDYLLKVPPPTTQQVKDQFDKFSDSFPKQPVPTTNPFGFGYKEKPRATLQLIRVDDDALNAAVVASKQRFDWQVEAAKYYMNGHSKDFPKAVAGSGTTQSAAAQYMSADEAEVQILAILRKQPVSDLRQKVEIYLFTTMNADSLAYYKFTASGLKTAEPDSSLGVPYTSFSYLQKLCDAVRTRFNVNLTPDNVTDFLPQTTYSIFPGVGSYEVTEFINKQVEDALALQEKQDLTANAVLFQPSQSLAGPIDSSRIFVRLSGVKKAQPPSDVALILPQVTSDWRIAEAYKLAAQDARSLQSAAQEHGLSRAAMAVGHPVIPPDPSSPLSLRSTDVKGVVPPLGDAAGSFVADAFKMLGNYNPSQPALCLATIEQPAVPNSRVFVAELESVKSDWDSNTFLNDFGRAALSHRQMMDMSMGARWIKYENVQKRLDYHPLHGE